MSVGASRRVYAGAIFDVHVRERRLPDGTVEQLETVSCPDAVRVYPVTGDRRVVMIEEHRAELGRWVLRVVAGRVERGELPLDTARRELAEELGYVAGSLTRFATSRPMLKVENTEHHVLATDLREGPACPEPGEDVRPCPVDVEMVERLVWTGRVVEDPIALNLLRLARRLAAEGER